MRFVLGDSRLEVASLSMYFHQGLESLVVLWLVRLLLFSLETTKIDIWVTAQELVYELSEYLSRRYPNIYKVTRHAPRSGDFGWYGEGQVKEITMVPVNATYNLDEEDPMKVSAML